MKMLSIIQESERNCSDIKLTDEIIKEVSKFNSSEELLRSGGISTKVLNKAAFGFCEDEIKTILPKQLSVKWKDDLDNVKYEINKYTHETGKDIESWAKKIDLSNPIEVSFERNRFNIEDGHHRYMAAKILGKPLNIKLEINMNPITKLAPNLSYDDFHRCIFDQVKNLPKKSSLKLFEIAQEINELDGEEIRQRYYEDIPLNIFLKIIHADPKSKLNYDANRENTILPGKIGKYSKILLDIYRKGNLNLEDLPKATEYLTAAYKYGVSLDNSKINSLADIFDSVKRFIAKGSNDPEITSQSLNPNEYNILYKGQNWAIYKPKTQRAACYLGAGTQWCTTWGKHSLNTSYHNRTSQYPSYSKQGTLYIIVNRLDPDVKYQFHFESNQFMDSSDRGIDVPTFLNNNKEVRNFFFPSFVNENVSELTKDSQLNKITLLSPNDASEILKKLLTDEELKNPLVSYFLGTGKKYIDFEFENPKTYPRNVNDVNSTLQYLSYSNGDSDFGYYDSDNTAVLLDAFQKYYKEFENDIRQKLHISTYEQFYDNFYKLYTENEKILDKLNEESNALSSEEYQNNLNQEKNKIEKLIKITEYFYEMVVSLPIGHLIPFILDRNYTSLADKNEIIDEYIEYYGLGEYPEIYNEYIIAEYDNKGDFHNAVVDYFNDFLTDDDNQCLKTHKKFKNIFHDIFKNEKTLENDIVLIQLKSTHIDCETETIPVIILNKQTNKRFEGDVKIDNLSTYAFNYKLFEQVLKFKKLI